MASPATLATTVIPPSGENVAHPERARVESSAAKGTGFLCITRPYWFDLGGGATHTLRTASAEIRDVPWAVKEQVLHLLANPEIAYLIFTIGMIGVMLELFHPGTIVPGVVGGICLLVAAIAFQMLPVNIGALLLVALGIAFFIAEMYVGGHGGFVAAGLVCVVIGSLLLVGHVDKSFYADADFGLGWRIVAPVGAAMAVIAGTLAGVAGYLDATLYGFVNPAQLGWRQSGLILVTVLLGGKGTLYGPALGALLLAFIEHYGERVTEHWNALIAALVIAVVLFLPEGAYPRLARLFRRRAPQTS